MLRNSNSGSVLLRLAYFNYMLMVFLILCSCREERQYKILNEHPGQSILDFEYINDTLGINLIDFRVTSMDGPNKKLELFMVTDRVQEYGNDHQYFVHLYPQFTSESSGNFVALGTNSIQISEDLIIYSREFSIQKDYFEKIRYGLKNSEGKRLFTLTLDTIQLQ